MFKRILNPVDGSEASAAASDVAIRIAKEDGAALWFVHVVEIDALYATGYGAGFDPGGGVAEIEHGGAAMLAAAVARAAAAGVAAEHVLVDGDHVNAIVALAEEHACDVIVIGTHGRQGLARIALGSVSDDVIHATTIPVLVVRAPEQPAQA
jgi:nucleotide-binding universal stress UspA family protein